MALGCAWAPTRLFPTLPCSGCRVSVFHPCLNINTSFLLPSCCTRSSSSPLETAKKKKNSTFWSSSGGSDTIISVVGRVVPRRRLLLGVSTFWPFVGMAEGRSSSFTASATPSRTSKVEEVLENVEWPEKFPFKDEDFQRFDESSDSLFYSSPRFVTHIDDSAINALTKYYSKVLPPSSTPGVCLLDLCSSWVSHYPEGYKQDRIVGLGMNEEELKRNLVLTEYAVQDLNIKPELPFEDCSFDVITNVVSVDYLTKPIIVFKEMARILKPGGLAIMSFSNRCFWTKAISIWTSTGDVDHAWIVGSYFHYAGGFEPPQAVDISPNPGRTDPMYIVFSRKLAD